MDLLLRDRVALVSGASRGLGCAIAAELASEGCRVAICARGTEALEEAAERMGGRPGILPVALDLTEPRAAARFVREATTAHGGIDIVVANVGGNRRKPFERTTDEDWRDLLELNLMAGVRLARESIPHLRARGGGSIIFVSSLYGREAGGAGMSIYTAAKAAVIGLVSVLARELAADGIRVNSVAPGSIRFPGGSWDRRIREDPEAMAEFVERELPLRRFGSPEEVAAAVAWLASPRASLITGACLAVDGAQGHSLI